MEMVKHDEKWFHKRPLSLVYDIKHLISLHYFEFAKDFIFDGEKHDFWELLYVDKGEVEVMANTSGYKLKQGDMIFHKPNEFHSVWANRKIASNVIVISFTCYSVEMSRFENKIFFLEDYERNLMANCVKYGRAAYLPPYDDPGKHDLVLRDDAPFGSEQMLKTHLELMLISLATRRNELSQVNRLSSTAKERSEDEIVRRTIKYMQDHVYANLTLDEISSHLNISQTHLVTLFKEKVGMSVIRYYKTLKIEQAKMMIREQTLNFTEISDLLSYSSIHTFSRHFKSVIDMTPSEYAKSVQARLQT
ncbi:AraC family transcriptional regulator [Cohnella silvisoli]|uniref:AraC family transcriptional regulator n=1 Tax=Cohnella silvisoli TaxID=2873699 RepID=A0ABV1L0U5_9BACL|nr:AraC family transcriptional regulator [Cohnella silvisoli]MCD9025385.1 AraC family transcriptional regulator [Cohnella silvisoli]